MAQTTEASQNFNQFMHAVVSPGTILMPAASATFSQFVSRPAGFDSGAIGYGEHFGIAIADNVSGKFIRTFVFPTLARQNVLYVREGPAAPFWNRVGRATLHSFVLNTGGYRINFSGVPASFAAAGFSNLYQPPEQKTWAATLQRAGTNAAGYWVSDLLAEFRPELCIVPKRLHIPCK
ncbi:MAG TPA: hypothetical protein VJA94_08695 [Candidatus Angelobacter sp.]